MQQENKKKKMTREERKQYMFVIQELTSREIKRKYARSYLGIIWSVLNPLLMMTVLSMIFTQLFSRSIENYPMYYLSGYVLWSMFVGATNAAMTTLVDNRTMLIKVRFPMQVFIIARVYTALTNLGYSLVAYVIMLVVFRIVPGVTIVFYPVIILLVLMFSLGLSLILATAYVFFGDVKHLYSIITTVWMYLSALFYPVDSIKGLPRMIIEINPIFQYINAARNVVMYHTWPSWTELFAMVAWAVGMLALGWLVFSKNKNKIMQKI